MRKLIMLGLLLLVGCGTLNKEKDFNKTSLTETLTQQLDEKGSNHKAIVIRDSLNKNMELTIWPKGIFKFSPTTGFEGEAFSLTVKQQEQDFHHSDEQSSSSRQVSSKLLAAKKEVHQNKQKKVVAANSAGGIWFFWLIFLAVVVLLWYYKKNIVRQLLGA